MIFPFRNIRDVLGLHAKVSSHKSSVLYYDHDLVKYDMSYLEFVGKSHQVANFLYEDLGINRGDTIAVISDNHINTLLLYFATWVIGAEIVAIDFDADNEHVAFILNDSGAKVLFAENSVIERVAPVISEAQLCEGVIQIGGDQREDFLRFSDLATNRPTTFLGDESGAKGADIPITGGNERTARLTDTALTVYHNKKTIRRTQGDLLYDAQQLSQATALTGNQTTLAVLPLYDNFVSSILAPLLVGATVILPQQVTPNLFWQFVVAERAHVSVLRADFVSRMVETAHDQVAQVKMRFGGKIIQQDIKHFRHIVVADETLTSQLACDFEDLFGIPLITAYKHPETDQLLTILPTTIAWTHHQTLLYGNNSPSIGMSLGEVQVINDNGQLADKGVLAIKIGDTWEDFGVCAYTETDDAGNQFLFLT